MLNIVIIGHQGCGKTEIVNVLKQLDGIQVIEFGDIVRKWHTEQNIKKSVVTYADDLFKSGSEFVICKKAIQLIEPNSKVIVFVGLRTKREFKYLNSKIQIDFIIGIRCKLLKRYYLRSKQKNKNKNFILRELLENRWEKDGDILDLSDIIINNDNNGVMKFTQCLKKILEDIYEK